MKIIDLLVMSITNLWKRKLRTVLTVLGVVIGITSIVVMVALGNGLKSQMMEDISKYSSMTQITVSEGSRYSEDGSEQEPKYLDDSLVEQIMNMEHVTDVRPELNMYIILKSGSYMNQVRLRGVSVNAMKNMKFELADGEIPESQDELKFLYGYMVPAQFYNEKTYSSPYYENGEVPVNVMNDSVFVVFDTDAYFSSGGMNGDSDSQIKPPKKYIIETSGIFAGDLNDWVPDSTDVFCEINALKKQLKQIFKKKQIPNQPLTKKGKPYDEIFYSQIVVQADKMENVAEITKKINDLGYYAYNDAEWIEQQSQQFNTIQMVLGAIGAVSLLVAAIGITNTMMMSIYERTKEIGVMKVLGCDIKNIQALFLMEAGFIGLVGGIIGLGFSYGLGELINSLVRASDLGYDRICVIPLWLPPLSILFAIVIGMIAGFLPSLRAMRLSPLAAIRNE